MKSVCLNCSDRCIEPVNCHMTCSKYLDEQEKDKKLKAQISQCIERENMLNKVKMAGVKKMKKRAR